MPDFNVIMTVFCFRNRNAMHCDALLKEKMTMQVRTLADSTNRRSFIGGSDARIIMGDDEPALLRLWREKRGEVEPEDLANNLIVQLGTVTEHLNRHWYGLRDHRTGVTGRSAA